MAAIISCLVIKFYAQNAKKTRGHPINDGLLVCHLEYWIYARFAKVANA